MSKKYKKKILFAQKVLWYRLQLLLLKSSSGINPSQLIIKDFPKFIKHLNNKIYEGISDKRD